jgi:Icc-related predicted phosphoesterase
MKIYFLSDIHSEFTRNIDLPTVYTDDVLVLAGDIGSFRDYKNLQQLVNRFSDLYSYVLYVPGNHEYYGSDISQKPPKFNSNVIVANNEIVTISDQRFICSTLWSAISRIDQRVNDFRLISGLTLQRYRELHTDSVAFITNNVRETDIVVTHHVPSYQLVEPKYIGDRSNCYFVNNLDDLVSIPKFWICGHIHGNNGIHKVNNGYVGINAVGYEETFIQPRELIIGE